MDTHDDDALVCRKHMAEIAEMCGFGNRVEANMSRSNASWLKYNDRVVVLGELPLAHG